MFLHGIPGIGKSELAKAYAKKYEHDYTNILYLPCEHDLRDAIIGLDFADDLPEEDDTARFKRHNRFLKSLKADNAFLKELRKQVERIAKAVMDTIPAIARGLEALRQKMVLYRYQIIHFRSAKWQAADELRKVKPDLKSFDELVAEIKGKTQEHKTLTKEKQQTPVWSLLKRNDLTKRIAQLTEELEELRSEKAQLLARFDYTEDKEMKQAKDRAKLKEKAINDMKAKENHCEQELDAALAEFQVLSHKAESHDPDTLWSERLRIWESMSQETVNQLKSHFGTSFSHRRLQSAASDVRLYLEEDERSMRQYVDRKRKAERRNMPQERRKQERER